MAKETLPYRSVNLPILGEVCLHPRGFWAQLKTSEGPLWAQIFKFGICGLIGLAVFMVCYFLFELSAPQYLSEEQATDDRQKHLLIAMLICSVPSNIVAFYLNRMIVFQPGRYGFIKEFTIFMLVAVISFLVGEVGKYYAVNQGYNNLSAVLVFAIGSAAANFVARRFFVFAR